MAVAGAIQVLYLRIERGYRPPAGREARPHAGRLYGSPAFLLRIGYDRNRRWRRLAALLRHDPPRLPDPLPPREVAERLHREPMDGLE